MKKGFTLIELLAVIVILAIIALIATPIVLSIINDAKESATLRSAEYYLDAVEQSVSLSVLKGNKINGVHSIMESGNLCVGTLNNNECNGKIVEVQASGELPQGGNIIIKEGQIDYATLNYDNAKVVKNYDGKVVKVLDKMCELVDDADTSNTITAGDKYSCEVKEGTSFNFYVLNTPTDENINLIMERNICEDGTVATAENKCLTNWISPKDYELAGGTQWNNSTDNNHFGPITAMNHTYKATKDWYNVPNIVIDYEDEGGNYGEIKTTGQLTQITKSDGAVVTVNETEIGYRDLKARLPFYSEIELAGCKCWDQYTESCEVWLMDFLRNSGYEKYSNLNHISDIYGYWNFSTNQSYNDRVYTVYADGYIDYPMVDDNNGVRPVITISEDNIKD